MDLDEIQSVQSRERQTDSLQQLRDSFYEEAGEFVRALRKERERVAANADDPFDAPEVNRLSDDIATAEQTLEAIYERRVGKLVKMASMAAADMPTEDGGLTTEEQDLFETLVEAIENNRTRVFDVLDGETADIGLDETAGIEASTDPAGSDPAEEDPESGQPSKAPSQQETQPDVSAADLMGSPDPVQQDDPDDMSDKPVDTPPATSATSGGKTVDEATRGDGGTPGHGGASGSDGPGAVPADSVADGIDRTTVKITDDVGEILGIDDRAYDLATDDVVALPETNVAPLLEQGVAKRLE
ncbi:hypothetical protein Hrd1104_04970 [Halorhabdus sp. CBA1104]|uniref:hypothetical protein n=1 Tax=Halorhabdus sp. CBA1104 TaxID=1380432 RepID=UPI0012B26450|nr:hypothetical protein [Halorhabdus sp. CBA1104]QGN06707.1 hypothetical protein Hrd1104_04970 [Halorhabdus sp. CBA1104]